MADSARSVGGLRSLGVPPVDRGQRVDAGDLLTDVRVVQPAGLARRFDQEVGLLGLGTLGVPRGAGHVGHEPALVDERGLQYRPSGVQLTDQVLGGNAGVRQEHLVELRFAGDLVDRPDLDAGLTHGQHEEADALMFRHVPVGPGQQHAVVGGLGVRRPHLLSVDHPVVTVALGPSAQAGQIRARAGLAVEQAPFALAADRRRNQPPLLLVGSRVVQRAGEQVRPVVSAAGRADGSEFGCDNSRLGIRQPAAVELRLPAGGRPSGVDHDVRPAGAIDVGIPVGRQPLSDPVAQLPRPSPLRLRSAADSVPDARTGCPATGRRCGRGADTSAPDAPR